MKKIIIDCDPGVDDAIALLLAFASPELEILGIVTVAGNVSLPFTEQNARKICELAKRNDIKVYAGCPRPILRSLETARHVHGETGLQGVELPEPQMPLQSQHGIEFLIETLLQASQPITLATLGPLTNLAIALIQAPQIIPKIQEVVLMGGSTSQGNVTASAEFNLYVDPHAAHIVFTSGLPLTMIGLNVTHKVLTTPERLQQIRAIATPVSAAAAAMLAHYGAYDIEKYGMLGSPLHDPCVIAYLVQPELFEGRNLHVAIEITSELTMGRSIVDLWRSGQQAPNAHVIQQANDEGFYSLLIQRLSEL
ncbi:MAG: nucleoside hydrolase [Timaviella obliquedivisa GSE-PSE-MK23-08B]|jgi:purine nucleosidase|nr:nucleoside hydrolase [Timaviella obliquedivisa GSE-PSE-MK23-08B]